MTSRYPGQPSQISGAPPLAVVLLVFLAFFAGIHAPRGPGHKIQANQPQIHHTIPGTMSGVLPTPATLPQMSYTVSGRTTVCEELLGIISINAGDTVSQLAMANGVNLNFSPERRYLPVPNEAFEAIARGSGYPDKDHITAGGHLYLPAHCELQIPS